MLTAQHGIPLALTTGFCWGLAPLFWSSAGRRIGAFNVNLLRMLLATVVLLAILKPYSWGLGIPLHIGTGPLAWLAVAGIVHMAIGDFFYYEAIMRLGPRRAVQMLTLFPVVAALGGWLWLGDHPSGRALAGMGLVLGSISYLAYAEGRMQAHGREPGRMTPLGALCGVAASICIGFAAVLTRQAFRGQGTVDPVMATTIRMAAGCAALWIVPMVMGKPLAVLAGMRESRVFWMMLGGTLVGPLVGMATYVAALKCAAPGLVTTLSATSPLFILPIVAIRYRTRPPVAAIVASIVAVAGVALLSAK